MGLPSRTNEECLAHRRMGASCRAYSFIELHGCIYGLCYRCVQILCDIGKPEKDEMYSLVKGLGFGSFMPRSGKTMQRDFVISYEVPATAPTKTSTNLV